MSTTARSGARGGKNAKADTTAGPAQKPPRAEREPKADARKSGPPSDKAQTPSHEQNRAAEDLKKQALLQPTAEQMRMAEIMESKRGDDLALKDKIKQVMDATQKTEDEVCTALHDCDNDANRAVNYLLEGVKDEWSTSEKKKKGKNRTSSATKGEAGSNNHVGPSEEDWDNGPATGDAGAGAGGRGRERARERGRGGPPRLRGRGSMESRGWRGRENKENERNLEDGERGSRRGGGGGRMFNGRGGRGGRGGGRLGSRTFQSRDKSGSFPRSIDTWNNPAGDDGSGEKMENWDANGATEDWDTEEPKPRQNENWGDQFPSPEDWDNEEYTGSLADSKVFTPSSGPEGEIVAPEGEVQEDSIPEQPPQPLEPLRPAQMPPSPVAVGTLTQAQTQFLTQLTQQSSERANYAQPPPQTYPTTYPAPPVSFTSTYNNYNSDGAVNSGAPVPSRPKTQKPRVPPPSKIPSSAVEMPPGDAIAVALLDVQFGGLEFGTDPEPAASEPAPAPQAAPPAAQQTPAAPSAAAQQPPAPTPPPPATVAASVATLMESYANSAAQQQASLANALGQKPDSLLSDATATAAANSYVQTSRPTSLAELSAATKTATSVAADSYATSAADATTNTLYQTQYQKTVPAPVTTYSPAASYSNSQVTSSSTGGYTSQSAGYTTGGTGAGGYGGAAQAQSAAQPAAAVNSSYPSSTYANSQTSYAAYTYPATNYQSGSAGYPQTAQQSYQNAANSYTSYPQQNHKMNSALSSQPKDTQYESGQVSSNSIPPASTVSSTPSLGLSTSQTVASTKVTALSTGNKSGMVAGIPAQVPPMMNTPYIMSQAAGLPYFQQPMTFSYDDALIMQQRMAPPPMPTQYFDMGFQQQPSGHAAAARPDANGLGNVAYSMSTDGRFTRTDNNASPVPSNQSVTQGHQQPMLNPTGLPPGYTYIFGSYPNFQYGTPLYPMAATAAAGNSTSGQYKGPAGYGTAGYGSGYEATPDGYKAGYAAAGPGAGQQAKTAGGTPTTSADLYAKGHAALNKVNSYDKAGFHSGTPPPFSQSVAPSGTYPPHLFIGAPLPPHQHQHSAAAAAAAALMHNHQPLHQDGANSTGARSQANAQPNKAGSKQQNYSPSFWTNSS